VSNEAGLSAGLSLAPFRAVRPNVSDGELGRYLCPPYDVIDAATRERLLAAEPENAVAIVLPEAVDGDPYLAAAARLEGWINSGRWAVDAEPALFVYEMRTAAGEITRGLLGAVELRDPADGVILPHENTMAGPVADRLALMSATDSDLEPIYLVYDGGGAASQLVAGVTDAEVLANAVTPDGTSHRLWAVNDHESWQAVDADLSNRRALIADGHHRYATYRELQRRRRSEHGPGPWDRGLTLLVDSTTYGPTVHPIHRVIPGHSLTDAREAAGSRFEVQDVPTLGEALDRLSAAPADEFCCVLTDGQAFTVVTRQQPEARSGGQPSSALDRLDVSVLHRDLIVDTWKLADTVDVVGYAHSTDEAIAAAQASGGFAVLLRATPVADVTAVAAAGERMPRKSTLFTPKPASGLVIRRFADQP
jgi:uncharacterized protein (DUF1015 family)